MCVSFSLSSTVEGTVKKKFDRTTNNELAPTWIHCCRAGLPKDSRTKLTTLLNEVGNSYLATESCMPFNTADAPTCNKNGCGASSYGKLPYISKSIAMPAANSAIGPKKAWDKIKQHLIDFGPVSHSFTLSEAFYRYSRTLVNRGNDEVFYYGHPDYKNHLCTYDGHQMTIVGYGHYKRNGKGKDKLYWIIQNSWGIAAGKYGYVFLAAGALESGNHDGHGIKVNEGTPFSKNLPLNVEHDEV